MAVIYWEDIKEADYLPSLPKIASTLTLVKWAGASGDIIPLHYDDGYAKSTGLKMPIVHGALKRQWLVQLVTDWAGDPGLLKELSCQYRNLDYPRQMKTLFEPMDGETWTCKGRIVKKYIGEKDEHLVNLDIWVENGAGEITTVGNATVKLPLRCKTSTGDPQP